MSLLPTTRNECRITSSACKIKYSILGTCECNQNSIQTHYIKKKPVKILRGHWINAAPFSHFHVHLSL